MYGEKEDEPNVMSVDGKIMHWYERSIQDINC